MLPPSSVVHADSMAFWSSRMLRGGGKYSSSSVTSTSSMPRSGDRKSTTASTSSSGAIALPRVASSTIATKVLLRTGQTAVLGGLVTDTDSVTETKLPLLGDIPVLGWLFKNKAATKSKNTLIVFVTPSVIRSPEDVDANVQKILQERQKLMQTEYDAIFGRTSGS